MERRSHVFGNFVNYSNIKIFWMWQLILKQSVIRYILIPINIVMIVACITLTALLNKAVPSDGWSDFVFWLLKPSLQVQLMMTCIILIVGISGNIRYNKCWQGSYAFFTGILAVVYIFSLAFSTKLDYSAETTVPRLQKEDAYSDEIYRLLQEMEVVAWMPTKCNCTGPDNCTALCERYQRTDYYEDAGGLAKVRETLTPSALRRFNLLSTIGTTFIVFYAIFLTVFTIIVSEESQASQTYNSAQ